MNIKVSTNHEEVINTLNKIGKKVSVTPSVNKAAKHLVGALKEAAPVGKGKGGVHLRDTFGVSKQKSRKRGMVLSKVGSLMHFGKYRIMHILEFGRKNGKGANPFMRRVFDAEVFTMTVIFTSDFTKRALKMIDKVKMK